MTDDAPPPPRPRLASHVLPRLHRVDGRERVVLFDQSRGSSTVIDPRAWFTLSMADGTRDLEGVLLAANREGAALTLDAVRAFFAQLHRAGMLHVDGAEEPASAPATPASRPLDVLPFRLHCDGRGRCCRQYSTVVFSTLDVARARSLLPTVEGGGDRAEWVFTPREGTGPHAACAVKQVDGACAYLDDGGGCRIHALAGVEAKPFGCSLYPARLVDDGEAVRVGPLVECACVLASVDGDRGDALIPPAMRTRADLHREVVVDVLPEEIALSAWHTIARADYVRWTRAVLDSPPDDAVPWLWRSADALDAGALPSPSPAGSADPSEISDAMSPWLRAWSSCVARVTAEHAAWRGPDDVVLQRMLVLHEALDALTDGPLRMALLAKGPVDARGERFYLHATAHAHGWVTERPLATQLRNLAMRLTLARLLERFLRARTLEGATFEAPITVVEATCRGYGLHADGPA